MENKEIKVVKDYKTMNLWQKMSAVMSDIEYLKKDDHISFKTTNYKAISEEKVTMSVRNALVKYGIVIMPVQQEHTRVKLDDNSNNYLSTVNVTYKILNIDNPSEFELVVSSGTGVDTQDKGVGKAMTYCYKYMLLRTFAIPTGEDTDKICSDELDEEEKKRKAELDKKNKSKGTEKVPVTPPTPQQNTTNKLSEKQVYRCISIAKSKGYELADVKKTIMAKYKKEVIEDLTKTEYDLICKGFENAKMKVKVGA